jgi:hypothetical protein
MNFSQEIIGDTKIIIDEPPVKTNIMSYHPAPKVIIGGAFDMYGPMNEYYRSLIRINGPQALVTGIAFVLIHEIGHSVYGASEAHAHNFMVTNINKFYHRALPWPRGLEFMDVVEMIKNENLAL